MNGNLFVALALAVVIGTESQLRGLAVPVGTLAVVLASALYRTSAVMRASALAALALGILNASWRVPVELTEKTQTVTVHGSVLGNIQDEGYGSTFTLRTDNGKLLSVNAAGAPPPIGSSMTAHGRLEPFDEARNPGEPSPRALAAERGLDARLEHAIIHDLQPPDFHDPQVWLPLARAWAGRQIRARMDEPYASILAGALWGERTALPPDLRAEFQDTGTVHILITAGLHLGVIATLAVAILTWLRCGRIGAALGSIPIVWTYAALSGAHLPSLRAATMASFALLARASGREALSWNALAAAAIVVAVGWPGSIDSVSFALSFSCVGAIVLFAERIAHALARLGLAEPLNEGCALTLATQIGTWPLTAATFLVFAPYAPLANALVVPLVGVTMLLGMAQLATSAVGPLAQGFANINESLLMWIVGVVHFTSSLPGAHVVATPAPLWALVAYDAALLAIAYLVARGRPRCAFTLFALACALVAWPPRAPRPDLVITAIDVGQADSLLIETPRGHAFLVDGGGRLERGPQQDGASLAEEVGERVVVPFLIRRGIHHLDAILLSHP
ncbi:MAG TPA: ComEC/Rec2 family competence protein, partial [Candidatus Baltobacteraceae bacterium]